MSEALMLSEAVPLGYAVLARVAEDAGVRMLAIKGPILEMQGLRAPRQSADIDVLVEPTGFETLTRQLEQVGWRNLVVYDCPGFLPKHSANHRHPLWPCEVDVHHWFPGFLADAAVSFEVFWNRRVQATLGARSVPTLDPVAHGALAALHYLREEGRGLRSADLESLAIVMQSDWTDEQRADLVQLAAATGASESLRPLLRRLGLPQEASSVPLAVPWESWRMRSDSSAPGVLPWLMGLRRTPWKDRPRFLLRALWPDPRQLNGVDPADPPRGRALLALRWSRFRRALRILPAAMADARRLGRGGP